MQPVLNAIEPVVVKNLDMVLTGTGFDAALAVSAIQEREVVLVRTYGIDQNGPLISWIHRSDENKAIARSNLFVKAMRGPIGIPGVTIDPKEGRHLKMVCVIRVQNGDLTAPRVFHDRLKNGQDLGNGAAPNILWMGSSNQTKWRDELDAPKRIDHDVGILFRTKRGSTPEERKLAAEQLLALAKQFAAGGNPCPVLLAAMREACGDTRRREERERPWIPMTEAEMNRIAVAEGLEIDYKWPRYAASASAYAGVSIDRAHHRRPWRASSYYTLVENGEKKRKLKDFGRFSSQHEAALERARFQARRKD